MYRHKMDVTSLIFGLIFAGIGALLLVGSTPELDLSEIWPALLVLAGLALLASAARNRDRRVTEVPVEQVRPAPTQEGAAGE